MKASDLKPGQFFAECSNRYQALDHPGFWCCYIDKRFVVHHCSKDTEVTPLNVTGWDDEPQSEPPRFDSWDEPTHWQLVDAALSCHHDYGLLPPEKQAVLRFEAKQWLHAWRKVFMEPSYMSAQIETAAL